MRMMPSRYAAQAQPVKVKKGNVAAVDHLTAPLKGLSLSSKLPGGNTDPLKATILDNWVIDEDKIRCRPGRGLIYSHPDQKPVEALVPFYGAPTQNMALGTNGKLTTYSGVTLYGGFASNDWSWVSFANLGQQTFTVMVNGADGVWSWDGGVVPPSSPAVAFTAISKANPAVVTVAAADIGKFHSGQNVYITGCTGGFAVCNGTHVIQSVNSPADTFQLFGIDTSAATGTYSGGATGIPLGSLVKENVSSPSNAPWIDPQKFHIVMVHQNHVWFADQNNLAIYYLPLQQKSGEVKYLPLNALFRRGGTVRALYSWTVDGGSGMNDQLCIFSSNGECAIYKGTDPDTDYDLVGVFRFDAPMSKNCVQQYGGELYVLISTGVVPMSVMMRSETEELGQTDRDVFSAFMDASRRYRDRPGWQLFLDPSTSRLIANLPQGALDYYKQMVRFMPNAYFTTWSSIPARSWGWLNSQLYIGDDHGHLYAMARSYLDDAGAAIRIDVQFAWSNYKSAGIKQFKMLKPYIITDGHPKPMIDMQVDYGTDPPANQPELTFSTQGGAWDVSPWDTTPWAQPSTMFAEWSGVGRKGNVGAPRLVAMIRGCEFALAGFDVLYETGSVMG